jgi:hypothetical protein
MGHGATSAWGLQKTPIGGSISARTAGMRKM